MSASPVSMYVMPEPEDLYTKQATTTKASRSQQISIRVSKKILLAICSSSLGGGGERQDPELALARDLAQTVSLELIAFIRHGREAHRDEVVRARVGRDGVRARFPDAGCEVEARLWVGRPVPVHDQLPRKG